MSAESVAQEQMAENKRIAMEGGKLTARLIKEIRDGLNPSLAMNDIMNTSKNSLSLKISELEQRGLLSETEATAIRDKIKDLGSFMDLEDGCYKSAALDEVTERLNNFKNGDSKIDLMKNISDCVKAPASIRTNTKGSRDFEIIKANIHIKAQQHGTLLHKETLNRSVREMKRQATKAIQDGTRAAVTMAGKGAATAAIGTSTAGIGFVVQALKEVTTAAGRALEKTAGINKARDGMERTR